MKCSNCNFDNPSQMKYCGNCGAKLATDIYERGRKHVTIFFADIAGSTALTENMDPEESYALIKPVFDAMLKSVHDFGGTVVKSAGDGIMSVFGAPIAFEDHALRACHAGILLQKTVKEMKKSIPVRIGMNSGEVVIEVTETDLGKEYDALGPAVTLAARMEQTAEPNTIQITTDTYLLVKDFITVQPRGKILIKGISEPVEVFELTGVKQEFSRFLQMRTSQLSTFVGRKAQMDTINHALEQVINGKGQVVGIMGEPGQGKSRLVYEFMNTAPAKATIQCTCQSQTIFQKNPYFVLKQMFYSLLQINNLMPQEDKIRIIKHQAKVFQNEIFYVLDLPITDPKWESLSSEFKRQEIIKSTIFLFLEKSEERPIICLIEDMQWIDNESMECINKLVDKITNKKVLLLLTFRPEFKHNWNEKEYFNLIPLSGLTVENFQNLAKSILGENAQVQKLKQQLVTLCNGNPFFLEETIHSLVDRKILGGNYGEFLLLQPLEHIVLPHSIQAVLDSRVDLLGSDPKNILKVCAVIGKLISINLLKKIVKYSDTKLESYLITLSDKNFISKVQEMPEVVYSFNHDVILETIETSMLKSQKKELHSVVLGCLETSFPSENQEQLIVRADHAFKAEKWNKAFDYYLSLQLKMHELFAPVESLEYAKKVGESFKNLQDPTKEQAEQYFHSILHVLHLFIWMGKFKEMHTYIDEGQRIIKILDDPISEAQFLAFLMTFANLGIGDYDSALRCTEKAQEILNKEEIRTGKNNQELQMLIDWGKLHAYYYLGEYEKCIHFANAARRLIKDPFYRDEISEAPLLAVCNSYTMTAYDHLGNFTMSREIEKEIHELQKIREPSVDLYLEISALCTSYCLRGDYELALNSINKSFELNQQLDLYFLHSELHAMKGFILSRQNKVEEAKTCLDESYKIAKNLDFVFKTCRGLNYLCEGYFNIQEKETAKEILEKMFELAEKRRQKGIEVMAWRLKGVLENSEEAYKKAAALAEERGMLAELAHCYKGLHLTEKAKDLYKKLGMVEQ